MKSILRITFLFALLPLLSCSNAATNSAEPGGAHSDKSVRKISLVPPPGKAIAVFAEGCFWCSEHIYDRVEGVDSALAGYSGGTEANPTYEMVSSESTDYAESVAVYYDPKKISYDELLNVFFLSQDPTTPDQQGPDRGKSYRSVIFYSIPAEKELANKSIEKWNKSGQFSRPIVTEVVPLTAFYRAEEYHQQFVFMNPNQGYVQNVSIPRFERFKRAYKGNLKPDKR